MSYALQFCRGQPSKFLSMMPHAVHKASIHFRSFRHLEFGFRASIDGILDENLFGLHGDGSSQSRAKTGEKIFFRA